MKINFLIIITILLSVNKVFSEKPEESGLIALIGKSYSSGSPQSIYHIFKRRHVFGFCQVGLQDTTREIVSLVKRASALVHEKGEGSFMDLRIPGSPWRQGEKYIFVLNPDGKMIVHPDPDLEGKNQLELKDINGKPIIRGLLDAVTKFPDKA